MTIKNLGPESTVLELKRRIHKEWVGTSPGKQQLIYGDIDLIEDSRTLASYGVFTGAAGSTGSTGSAGEDVIPVITMYSLVNMLTHQGRFINLQRYVWSGGSLKVLSPLAAVDSVESLQNGVLASSSLSMTSRDSFLLWQEISRYTHTYITTYIHTHAYRLLHLLPSLLRCSLLFSSTSFLFFTHPFSKFTTISYSSLLSPISLFLLYLIFFLFSRFLLLSFLHFFFLLLFHLLLLLLCTPPPTLSDCFQPRP